MSEKHRPTHSTRASTWVGPGFTTGLAVLRASWPGPTSWTAYCVAGRAEGLCCAVMW